MLEDSNVLVYIEAIKTIELLVQLRDRNLPSKKIKQITLLLIDKFKETKSAVPIAVRHCLNVIVASGIVALEATTESILQHVFQHKNPRVKQMALEYACELLRDAPNVEEGPALRRDASAGGSLDETSRIVRSRINSLKSRT